jgi:catabolite regulation protein CreA
MLSHDLAKILLDSPNLPIATHAKNHTYMSGIDAESHGVCKVGLLHTYGGDHIIVGNISKRNINGVNWHVTNMIHGDAPQEW